MDCGNSGSLQSTSGGDENYDSSSGGAATDHSPFLNPPLNSSAGDTNLNNIIIPHFPNLPSSSSHHYLPHQAPILNHSRPIPLPSAESSFVVTKNPKKRTRASRRAPTTVLTTDTTNFRSMVQEFTGVPSPPQSFYNPFRSAVQKVQTLIPSSIMNHQITVGLSNIVTPLASQTMNFHSLPDLPLPKLPLETQNTQVPTFQSHLLSQQQHQSVSSLHELNAMNLRALRPHHHNVPVSTNGGYISRRDQDPHHHHHHHRSIIRQFDVPSTLPEFDRREKGTERNNNVSTSSSSIKGTNTTTTTTVDGPWICPTD